ncbi:MAG: HlyC/CorC family transporter [Flavobacteriales bacterium]|nr:HlyC/CorC family transporter [Flavobacteriales bacterium]
MDSPIFLILVSLGLAAFFSGLEIAFLSANKLRIELKSKQGHRWANILSNYYRSPSRFISTILVAYNIMLVIFGIFIGKELNDILSNFNLSGGAILFISTIISTGIVLFSADFLPKVIFSLNPNLILSVLIYPFQVAYYILWPVVNMVIWISKTVLRVLTSQKFIETAPAFTKVDLGNFIAENLQDNKKSEVDAEILKNALDFSNVRVRDFIVPRTELVAIDLNDTVENLLELFKTSNHSKILVYQNNIDNIIGYVHQVDMFKNPKSIKSILMPIIITNESKTAQQMLNEFVKKRKSIALVVDEFGGTAGIITVEDIMEEILGEIDDEHDVDDDIVETKISENEYEFSASLEVDYLNEKYGFQIPEGDYETLAGYIIASHGSIPEVGETFNIERFNVKILKFDEARIVLVRLVVLGETE